MCYINKY